MNSKEIIKRLSELGVEMIYPAYVHLGDEQHAHGVTLPDFDGCFTAADEYADISKCVQEAIELHFEGEELEIPAPSDIRVLELSEAYQEGVWMLIDIDIRKLESKPIWMLLLLKTI